MRVSAGTNAAEEYHPKHTSRKLMDREFCEFKLSAKATLELTRSCVTEIGSDSIEPNRKPLKTGMRG